MSWFRAFSQNLLCLIAALLFSYFFSGLIGSLYCAFDTCSAGLASADFTGLAGAMLGYFLFTPIFLASFGGSGKYWWAAILMSVTILGMIYLGIRFSQLSPMLITIVGGFIAGILLNKALWKLAPKFMAKIG